MFSKRTLIPLLLFLYTLRVVVLIRQQEDVTAVDTYSIVQVGIIGLLVVALIIQRYLVTVIKILMRSPLLYLILLYVLGMASYFWSAIPALSGYFAFQGLVLIIAIAVYLYRQMRVGRLERTVLMTGLVLLAMNVVGHMGIAQAGFNLESWHTNSYSAIAAMLAAYCIGELASNRTSLALKQNRRLLLASLCVALLFLGLGTSGGSNVAFVAGLLVAALYSGRMAFKVVAVFLFAGVLIINMFYAETLFSLLFPGKTMESVENLTGRTSLWEFYLQMIEEKPLFGWGFAAPERLGQIYTTNTHNIVLAITASLGLFGLGLFTLYLIAVSRRALFGRYKAYYGGVVCALAVGLVNGMSVGFLASGAGPVFLAFIIWNVLFALKPLAITQYPQAQRSQPTRGRLGVTIHSPRPQAGVIRQAYEPRGRE